jgi:hypothetical protein
MEYRPSIFQGDRNPLGVFLEAELRKIQEALSSLQSVLSLKELHAEPPKPRNGDIVYADGTDWDPGSGRGVYLYKGATWTLLG